VNWITFEGPYNKLANTTRIGEMDIELQLEHTRYKNGVNDGIACCVDMPQHKTSVDVEGHNYGFTPL
jgi:hypothetical protein